jgi:hypothetical protein
MKSRATVSLAAAVATNAASQAVPLSHCACHCQRPISEFFETPDGVSLVFAAGLFAGGVAGSLDPDMDLSSLPMVPPVLPAWASAEDTFANAKYDRASEAIAIHARRLILPAPPRLREGIVLVKYGYWKARRGPVWVLAVCRKLHRRTADAAPIALEPDSLFPSAESVI